MAPSTNVSESPIEIMCAKALDEPATDHRSLSSRCSIFKYKHEVRIPDPDDFYRVASFWGAAQLKRSGDHIYFYARLADKNDQNGELWTIMNTNEANTFVKKYGPSFTILPFQSYLAEQIKRQPDNLG